jgi:serine/threonine protein kinase
MGSSSSLHQRSTVASSSFLPELDKKKDKVNLSSSKRGHLSSNHLTGGSNRMKSDRNLTVHNKDDHDEIGEYQDKTYEMFQANESKDDNLTSQPKRLKKLALGKNARGQVREYNGTHANAHSTSASHLVDWNVTDPPPTSLIVDLKSPKLPASSIAKSSTLPVIFPTHDTSRLPSSVKRIRPSAPKPIDKDGTAPHVSLTHVVAPSSLPPPTAAIDSSPDMIEDLLSKDELAVLHKKHDPVESRKVITSSNGTAGQRAINKQQSAAESIADANLPYEAGVCRRYETSPFIATSASLSDANTKGFIDLTIDPSARTQAPAEQHLPAMTNRSQPPAQVTNMKSHIASNVSSDSEHSHTSDSGNEDDMDDSTSVYDWIDNVNASRVLSRVSTRGSELAASIPLCKSKHGSFMNVLESASAASSFIRRASIRRSSSEATPDDATPVVLHSNMTSPTKATMPSIFNPTGRSRSNSVDATAFVNHATVVQPAQQADNVVGSSTMTSPAVAAAGSSTFQTTNILSPAQQVYNRISSPLSAIVTSPARSIASTNPLHSPSAAGGQAYTVKETKDVKRNIAQLPRNLNHPKPTTGDWINKRYFVNNYILLDTLGKGSYGEVRLCRDRQYSDLYAMKIISKDMMKKRKNGNTNETYFEDIKREIAIMKKLLHPNVLRLYEVLDDPKVNKLYLVLEYMKKGDLLSYLRDKYDAQSMNTTGSKHQGATQPGNDGTTANAAPATTATTGGKKVKAKPILLDELELWNIFRQVSSGLKYLHYQSVVHGDIKPQNLLVSDDGIVKIADFGISKMLHASGQRLADAGGTPAFMSPELCSGETFSGQLADVWALGATMFMLRFGHPPFVAKTILNLYNKIQNDSLVFPFAIDASLKDLLSRMLEKDPEKRLSLNEVTLHPWLQVPPQPSSSANNKQQLSSLPIQNTETPTALTSGSQQRFQPPKGYDDEKESAMNRPIATVNEDEIYQSIGLGHQSKPVDNELPQDHEDSLDEDIMHTKWGEDVFQIVDEDGAGNDSEEEDDDDKDTVDGDDNDDTSSADDSPMKPSQSPKAPPGRPAAASPIPAIQALSSERMLVMDNEEEERRMKRFQHQIASKKPMSIIKSTSNHSDSSNEELITTKAVLSPAHALISSHSSTILVSKKSSKASLSSTPSRFSGKTPPLGSVPLTSITTGPRPKLSSESRKDSDSLHSLELEDDTDELTMEAFSTLMDTLAMQPKAKDVIAIDESIDLKALRQEAHQQLFPSASRNLQNQIACAFHSEQGHRGNQEDRCVLVLDPSKQLTQPASQCYTIGCIFDGHSGDACAEYLYKNFVPNLIKHEQLVSSDENHLEAVLRDVCKAMDDQVSCLRL